MLTIGSWKTKNGGQLSGDGIGFFGAAQGATIQNLKFDQASLNTTAPGLPSYMAIGILVGWQVAGTVVRNVQVTNSTINDSAFRSNVGGLAGWLDNYGGTRPSVISQSAAHVNVSSAGEHVGGLVGLIDTAQVFQSHASGSVTANGAFISAGGLAGFNAGTITDSYAISTVTGAGEPTEVKIGGLVGVNNYNGVIERTYATGDVSSVDGSSMTRVGGLVGENHNDINSIKNSFWDADSTGQSTAIGFNFLSGTAGELRSTTGTVNAYTQSTYTGFDFNNVWWMADGATRPFLRSEWRPVITNAHELQLVGVKPTLSYTLANNIDLEPSLKNQSEMWKGVVDGSSFQGNWSPIADYTNAFGGVFDGNNKTISNLYILKDSGTANTGLFAVVRDGTIKDLTLSGGSITALGDDEHATYVGALAGQVFNKSTITNVSSNLYIEGHAYVGGLIGAATGDSETGDLVTISNSTSSGKVVARQATAGGLVGEADGFSITNSSATGDVEAEYYVGGLVATASNGTITGSHATGQVTGGSYDDEIGGLVGSTQNTTIDNSYATGNVSGGYSVGGLIGVASDGTTITNSRYTTGTVSGIADVGGLVGSLDGSTISNSYATGAVEAADGAENIGGLVGYVGGGSTITRSYATSTVTVGDNASNIGGLVGYVDGGSVDQSYATGNVTAGNGASRVGGLIGQFYDDSTPPYEITDSYATGDVTVGDNSSSIGGLIGSAEYGLVARTYAVGAVTAGTGSTDVGGLIGAAEDTEVESSFWNTNTTGQSSSAGGEGKTTAQMQDIATFSDWDIEDDQTLTDLYPRLTMSDSGPVWKIKSVAASGGGDTGGGGGGGGGDTGGGGAVTTDNSVAQNAAITSAQGGLPSTAGQPTPNTAPTGTSNAQIDGSSGLAFVEVDDLGQTPPSSGDGARFLRFIVVQGGIKLPGYATASADEEDARAPIGRRVRP